MKLRSFVMITVAVSAITVGVRADSLGEIHRLAAEFRWAEFASATTASANGADGTLVYTKTLFVPRNTLFVTIHATADVHGGAALQMACLVDGVPCRPEPVEIGGAPIGWVTLQRIPAVDPPATVSNCNNGGGGSGDCHDNNITYSWCTSVRPGVHTVDLKLASSLSGVAVFLEKAQIYIDNGGRRGRDDDDDDDDDDRRRSDQVSGCTAALIPQ